MNRTILFASAGALATALLMAMLLSAMVGKKDDDAPRTEILVAAKDLPIGAALNGSNTKWQAWQGTPVQGSIVRSEVKDEDWQKRKIRRALAVDEPVTRGAMLEMDKKGNLLSARLDKGMRAVSINVNAASGVSGFLSADDRVDVILVYTMRIQSDTTTNNLQEIALEKGAETILQNVRVLAADQDAEGAPAGETQAKVSKTITLEVNKAGAEKLALAMQMGELHLTLRQMGDASVAPDDQEPVTDVKMGHILNKLVTTRNQMESPGRALRVYSGQTVQEVPVRGTILNGATK